MRFRNIFALLCLVSVGFCLEAYLKMSVEKIDFGELSSATYNSDGYRFAYISSGQFDSNSNLYVTIPRTYGTPSSVESIPATIAKITNTTSSSNFGGVPFPTTEMNAVGTGSLRSVSAMHIDRNDIMHFIDVNTVAGTDYGDATYKRLSVKTGTLTGHSVSIEGVLNNLWPNDIAYAIDNDITFIAAGGSSSAGRIIACRDNSCASYTVTDDSCSSTYRGVVAVDVSCDGQFLFYRTYCSGEVKVVPIDFISGALKDGSSVITWNPNFEYTMSRGTSLQEGCGIFVDEALRVFASSSNGRVYYDSFMLESAVLEDNVSRSSSVQGGVFANMNNGTVLVFDGRYLQDMIEGSTHTRNYMSRFDINAAHSRQGCAGNISLFSWITVIGTILAVVLGLICGRV
ncbi:hypothetical protein PCE1_000342 [Barthelona sp. PCE]